MKKKTEFGILLPGVSQNVDIDFGVSGAYGLVNELMNKVSQAFTMGFKNTLMLSRLWLAS